METYSVRGRVGNDGTPDDITANPGHCGREFHLTGSHTRQFE